MKAGFRSRGEEVARGTFGGAEAWLVEAVAGPPFGNAQGKPHSRSAVDDGFEVGFAAENESGTDHLNELLAAKIGKQAGYGLAG